MQRVARLTTLAVHQYANGVSPVNPDHASQAGALWAQLLAENQAELGRSIHDDFGPTLAAMRLATEAAKRGGDVAAALSTVDAGIALLQKWIDARRERLRAGRMSKLGLEDALSWYAADFEHTRGVVFSVHSECTGRDLPLDVTLATLGFADDALMQRIAGPTSACSVALSLSDQTLRFELGIANPRPVTTGPGRFAAIFRALGGTIEESERPMQYGVVMRLSFRR
jgi:hypothetical protein